MKIIPGKTYVNRKGSYPRDTVNVASVTDGKVSYFPSSGGFGMIASEEKFTGRYREPTQEELNNKTLRKIRVTGDWLEEGMVYDAYTTGATWNGWEVPLVTLETVKKFIADLKFMYAASPDGGYDMSHDEEKDAIVVIDRFLPENEQVPMEYKGQDYETVDGTKHLYVIGDGFCWVGYEEGEE